MRYKTVLFDADGTLLDFLQSEREALSEALLEIGVVADEEMIKAYSQINDSLWKLLEKKEIERSVLVYRRFEMLFERYGIESDAMAISDRYINIISTKGYMLDGALSLLEKLYGKVRMYIITNGAEVVQRGRYEKLSLYKFFDGFFISECVGVNKPDVRFFERVSNDIEGFDRESTIVVGDSLSSDIKGGNSFGLDTCWYNPLHKTAFEDIVPKYTAYTFDEVERIILG